MTGTELLQPRLEARRHARSELTECLVAENQAERDYAVAEAAIWRYRDEAASVSEDDDALEAFVEWLPQGRKQLQTAQTALERAQAETLRARAVLAHADGAVAAAERISRG